MSFTKILEQIHEQSWFKEVFNPTAYFLWGTVITIAEKAWGFLV